MLGRVLRRIGLALLALILIAVVAAGGLSWSTTRRLNRDYTIQPEAVVIPGDAESLARGEHLAQMLCTGCHHEDFGGGYFFEDPALGLVDSANLTSGQGGIGASYSDADFVRALRHGVGADGKPLFIMPSRDFYYLSDGDLGALIAYIKTPPPVDRTPRPMTSTYFGRILVALGAFGDVLDAETIAHGVRPPTPAAGVSVEYGEYLVNIIGCRTCHGANLAGGKDPNPDAPPGPNLTRGGALGGWQEADFVSTLRTGVTPSGTQLNGDFMPWKSIGRASDEELSAIWTYLQSLPARP